MVKKDRIFFHSHVFANDEMESNLYFSFSLNVSAAFFVWLLRRKKSKAIPNIKAIERSMERKKRSIKIVAKTFTTCYANSDVVRRGKGAPLSTPVIHMVLFLDLTHVFDAVCMKICLTLNVRQNSAMWCENSYFRNF